MAEAVVPPPALATHGGVTILCWFSGVLDAAAPQPTMVQLRAAAAPYNHGAGCWCTADASMGMPQRPERAARCTRRSGPQRALPLMVYSGHTPTMQPLQRGYTGRPNILTTPIDYPNFTWVREKRSHQKGQEAWRRSLRSLADELGMKVGPLTGHISAGVPQRSRRVLTRGPPPTPATTIVCDCKRRSNHAQWLCG